MPKQPDVTVPRVKAEQGVSKTGDRVPHTSLGQDKLGDKPTPGSDIDRQNREVGKTMDKLGSR